MDRRVGLVVAGVAVLAMGLLTLRGCTTSHQMAVWRQRAETNARRADSVVAVNKELTRQVVTLRAAQDTALRAADSLRALRQRIVVRHDTLPPLPPDTANAAAWRTVARAEREARDRAERGWAIAGEEARLAVLETQQLRSALTAANARAEIEARGRLLALATVDSLRVVIRAAPIPKGPCRVPLIGMRCELAAGIAGAVVGATIARQ